MKKNEIYVAPELEIINVMVETGFDGSIKNPDSGIDPMPDDGDI